MHMLLLSFRLLCLCYQHLVGPCYLFTQTVYSHFTGTGAIVGVYCPCANEVILKDMGNINVTKAQYDKTNCGSPRRFIYSKRISY